MFPESQGPIGCARECLSCGPKLSRSKTCLSPFTQFMVAAGPEDSGHFRAGEDKLSVL